MSEILFVLALPGVLFSIGYGFYHLGRILTVLAVARWGKKKKDR